jgi:hypothetical protein
MFESSGARSGSDQKIATAKSTVYHCAGEGVNGTGSCASECLGNSMCSQNSLSLREDIGWQ